MGTINDVSKALKGPGGPGAVKSVLAGLAIAWGSRTAMRVAADAADRTAEASATLATLQAEIDQAHNVLSERLVDAIREGYADAAVKARAAALGWGEVSVPDEPITLDADPTDTPDAFEVTD